MRLGMGIKKKKKEDESTWKLTDKDTRGSRRSVATTEGIRSLRTMQEIVILRFFLFPISAFFQRVINLFEEHVEMEWKSFRNFFSKHAPAEIEIGLINEMEDADEEREMEEKKLKKRLLRKKEPQTGGHFLQTDFTPIQQTL
ncbi:hypothetical protein RUM43_003628 [Polyplax serrata]|uniref:Uncharacterized protein n=1 Tax=Polyplax serrata TaxID=468196 RepID=A0AAN8Q1F9_POLSC